jgi:carbon-monoxide dehydrogenase medium subunit
MGDIMFSLGIPKVFKYYKPSDVSEAIGLLSEGGRALAGGQSLLPLLKLRLIDVERVVDINELDFRYIKDEGGYVRIGALTTHSEIASSIVLRNYFPSITNASWNIADLQVRNRGTIGGSISHADPSANYIPSLLILDAELTIIGKSGERKVKLRDFIKGPYLTQMNEGEIVKEVIVPKVKSKNSFLAIKMGGASFPSINVAVLYEIEGGIIFNSRIAIGAVYKRPVIIEKLLDHLSIEEVEKRVNEFSSSINEELIDDYHLPKEYKLKILGKIVKRAIIEGQSVLRVKEAKISWASGRGLGAGGLIRVKVNGREIESYIEPRVLLLDFLRANGFKEVRRGCDEGKCGACTVLLNDRSVKSCLVLAVQANGFEVKTIKGLHEGRLNYIQRAFLEEMAMQCGYCTHGFMMVTHDYLNNIDPDAREETLKYCIKNICRCSTYFNIRKAIKKSSHYLKDSV